ncbi:MAG TPA: fatty acid desaturase [Rhodocyclaceae bacterium]|nr:fatty acid desaturase [Rhodocyclaceae bacterium]
MPFPLIELPWWAYVPLALVLTHITIAAVTIFLHRHQAHRALALHPVASHFFRFWLWLTTGTVTKEWVAVHRKHHAKCETAEDPHSPVFFGIGRVLSRGAELYRAEADKPETLAKYGQNTPDDGLEKHLYSRYPMAGISAMLIAEVWLFGPLGLTVWAVQMMWIPFFAAGVINGLGHYFGYRSFATADASRNIVPWGILIGGEELHNNHHAYSASARLSNRRWEFDIGWFYIRLLALLRLATVRKVAPTLHWRPGKAQCDDVTVHAVLRHRFAVLAGYAQSLRQTVRAEIIALRQQPESRFEAATALAAVKHWLQKESAVLPPPEQVALDHVIHASPVVRTIYAMRQELAALWNRSQETPEQLVRQLEDWCQRAEASGIAALQQFSRKLRSYA